MAKLLAHHEVSLQVDELLEQVGQYRMSACAYDVAWLARVPRWDTPGALLFPGAVEWLLANQHGDGSWGASIALAHDRVVCTLAAVVALAHLRERDPRVEEPLRRGASFLRQRQATVDTTNDPVETVGFELVVPTLLEEARAFGLRLPTQRWEYIRRLRAEKLQRLPPGTAYSPGTTLLHSLEHLGTGAVPALARRAQLPNGSYGASPSATAFALTLYDDPAARAYLQQAVASTTQDGGVCDVFPIDVFEYAWTLYNFRGLEAQRPELKEHAAALAQLWKPNGVCFTSEWDLTDGDDTAIAFLVLQRFGHRPDPVVFHLFEIEECFACFALERNPSVSTNAHVLEALTACPQTTAVEQMCHKARTWLLDAQAGDGFWRDKWHASPYYASCQAATALASYAPEALRRTLRWLLDAQHPTGGWGMQDGTSEETAYALETLLAVAPWLEGEEQDRCREAIGNGVDLLQEHLPDGHQPELWVGKALYTPYTVVQSAILGALCRALSYLQGQGARMYDAPTPAIAD